MNINTTNTKQEDALEKSVFEKIHSGEVKMRPKSYFVLKVGLLAGVALLVLATSAVLVSFMMFSLRVSGRLFLIGFGGRGLLAFFITFPWFILLADILFVVFFERMLNHFKFGYRLPLLYTLGASVVVIILAGVALDHISIHDALFQEAQQHRLGPINGLYTDVRLPPREVGVFRGIVATSTGAGVVAGTSTGTGTVIFSNSNSFNMRRDDEDANTDDATDTAMIWRVILPANINVAGFIQPGDVVLVAGDVLAASGSESGIIRAYGIRKIEASDEQ